MPDKLIEKWPLGTQVAYIPSHCKGDIKHKDVQFGFVTSRGRMDDGNGNAIYFVRYFAKGKDYLRTKANSEATSELLLVPYQHHPQALVARMIKEILEEHKHWLEEKPGEE